MRDMGYVVRGGVTTGARLLAQNRWRSFICRKLYRCDVSGHATNKPTFQPLKMEGMCPRTIDTYTMYTWNNIDRHHEKRMLGQHKEEKNHGTTPTS